MATWREWVESAKDDLSAAENLGQSGFYAQACFWCQQAAEKALKALLVFKTGNFPKIHSLRELAVEAGVLKEVKQAIAFLDGDYAATRHLDAEGRVKDRYDRKKFESRIAEARRVLELVEKWTRG